MIEKKLFSAAQLANYLGIPIKSIYTYKCRGQVLPKEALVKLPGSMKLFFDKTIIDNWVDKHHLYQP